jgi:predicted ATPase/DNA-binding SARP family transcriptional activator
MRLLKSVTTEEQNRHKRQKITFFAQKFATIAFSQLKSGVLKGRIFSAIFTMSIASQPAATSVVRELAEQPVQLILLGHCTLRVGEVIIRDFATDKERALLAYLALEPADTSTGSEGRAVRPQRRERLAALFWPESPPATALKNLRQSLYRLKQTIDGAQRGLADQLLRVTAKEVQLERAGLHIDVVALNAALHACEKHAHRSLAECPACLTQLGAAVALYQGELLAGLGVRDAPLFEEWLLLRRETLHHQVLLALQNLATAHEARGELTQAYTYATQQLTLDPYREDAHRQVIRLLAYQGLTHQALAHYADCRRLLEEEFGIPPAPETVALYEQIRAGKLPVKNARQAALGSPPPNTLATDVPPLLVALAPTSTLESALPTQHALLPLLGRDDELARLVALLQQPTCRFLTLVGPPGVGKTRLAQAILAWRFWSLDFPAAPDTEAGPNSRPLAPLQNPNFPDGVFWVDLTALRDPALVLTEIATLFDVGEHAGRSLFEALVLRLRAQQALLMLDNFEQVASAAPTVAQLLAHCPALKVLVTSRVTLHVTGEQVFTLSPLALPSPTELAEPGVLGTFSAVQLFVQRASAVKPDFQLNANNAPVIAAICRHLDGLPLAIELAAARSRLLAPAAMLARLEDRLQFLTSSGSALTERHKTLRAAIAWSYELLTPAEQWTLQHLAVFVGGFTLEAAEAIIDKSRESSVLSLQSPSLQSPSPPVSVLDTIESLLDKHLLRLQESALRSTRSGEDHEPRFTMLETVRAYGLTQLAATAEPDRDRVRRRHAHFFLTWAERIAPKLFGAEQIAWLNRLEVDHDNLRAAQAWFLEQGDADGALRLATALRYFWRVRCYYSEGTLYLQRALALPAAAAPTALRAQALNAAGYLAWVRGERATAQALLTEALATGRHAAAPRAVAFALRYLGVAADAADDVSTAQAHLAESLAIYRHLGEQNDIALSLLYLGDVAMRQNDHARATQLYHECAALLHALHNNITLPYAWRRLGYLALWRSAHAEALTHVRASLRLNFALGEKQGVAAALVAVAAIALAQGAATEAATLLGAVEALLETIHTQLLHFDQAQQQAALTQAQTRLAPAAFAEAWASGQRLGLPEAITFAEALTLPPVPADEPSTSTGGAGATIGPPPTPSSSVLIPHNLPALLPPLIGRTAKLADLIARLHAPETRLLTLVGMGGMGKTRLALAAAEAILDGQRLSNPKSKTVRLSAHGSAEASAERRAPAEASPQSAEVQNLKFPDGVWFVPLAAVDAHQPALSYALTAAVGRAVGLTTSGGDDGQTQLFGYLARRRLLLILDNFEHLLARAVAAQIATDFVVALSDAAPEVSLLITSRAPLRLEREQVLLLEGLAVPNRKATDGATFESVQLFVREAQRSAPTFHIDATTLPDVIAICQLVGGMPLGLALAATLVRHLTLAEIVRAIATNPTILASPRRDLDERHRRLATVFDYSWHLLDPAEQQALAQTAIFVGSFSGAAASVITEATPLTFINLVDNTLLRQSTLGFYELHELLHQFAAEKLATYEPAFITALQARYTAHYLGFVTERTELLRQRQAHTAIAELQREGENIRRAWELALAHRWAAPVADALPGLLRYWKATGRYVEGEALVAAALPVFTPVAEEQPLLAHLWLTYGACLYGQNRWQAAVDAAEQALALSGEAEHLAAQALVALAEGLSWQGRQAAAHPVVERALALAQRHHLWEVEIRALITLAGYETTLANRLAPVAQALQIAQQQNDPYFELVCIQNLAGACENAGEYARSLPYRRQALQLAKTSQDRYQIGEAHYLYGLIHVHLGLYEPALEHFEQARALAEEYTFTWLAKRTLNRTAMVYCALGKLDQAYDLSVQARTLAHGERASPPYFDFVYGQILHAQGHWAEATTLFQRILAQKRATPGIAHTRQLPELAELARLALRQTHQHQAESYATAISTIVSQHPHCSASDLYFDRYAIDLARYEVLQATNAAEAMRVLTTAYQHLWAYATTISDEATRHAYLNNIATNRGLVAAWQATQRTPPSVAPPNLLARPRHQLPRPATPLIGRDKEIAALVALLQQPQTRLLSVIGPGGMGKTRLALAAAQTILDSGFSILDAAAASPYPPKSKIQNLKYKDGLFFVALASLTSPAALAPAIATALGLSLTSGDLRQALCEALRERQLLLILDNFEHLLPSALVDDEQADAAVELVAQILQVAPGVQILTATRQRLQLRDEQLYPVHGLSLAQGPTLAEASTSAALALFVQNAQRIEPHFTVNDDNLPAVLHICQLLEGMPLGLEMAAAWVDQLSPAEIATEIARSSDFLALTWHDLPPRQRSMRAVFDWSWRLLDADERRALSQLAIFRGGFTRHAATTVTGTPLRVLTSLVYKSLLRRTTDEQGEGRYDLHELLRQFADEVLQTTPTDAWTVAAQHSAFYLTFVAERTTALARHAPRQAVAQIQAELDNIRQAWTWAANHAQQTEGAGDPSTHLDASAYALWQFYLLTGPYTEGSAAFHTATVGLQAALAVQSADPQLRRGREQRWSKLLALEAYLLSWQGEHHAALPLAQQAIDQAVASAGAAGELVGLMTLIHSHYHLGQFAETRRVIEHLLERIQTWQGHMPADEFIYEAELIAGMYSGGLAKSFDRYAEARDHFTGALRLCQGLGKLRGELHARLNLANVERYCGNYSAARTDYEQVLRLARHLGYRWGEGVTQYELADVLRGQGDYGAALTLFTDALTLLRAINEPLRAAYAIADLSRLYSYLGAYPQAAAWLQQAQLLSDKATARDARVDHLLAATIFHHHTGDQSAALHYATHCQAIAQTDGSQRSTGVATIYMGYALEAQGEWAKASGAYTYARRLFEELSIGPTLTEALAGLARIAMAQGDMATAHAHIQALLLLLDQHHHVGVDEPFRIYLTVYQVLAAVGDAQARSFLARGYQTLRQYAEQLPNDTLRSSFLEHVPSHRALHEAYMANRT